MSEMGKLERKFLKLYDTVGKNKNTTSKSDVKNMVTDVDRDSENWYNFSRASKEGELINEFFIP